MDLAESVDEDKKPRVQLGTLGFCNFENVARPGS